MTAQQNRLDVGRIMRGIRDETRAHQEEVVRRIEHASRELDDQMPWPSEEELRATISRLNEVFARLYEPMLAYLNEQEPNFANIQYTFSEINRLLTRPEPPRGPRDRWWNPWFWLKRSLSPLRRFVLRRQYEVNALVRDTLGFLVNHSGHVAAQRLELELGVEMVRALGVLLEEIGGMRQRFGEWSRVALLPVAEYVAQMHERFCERQLGEIASLRSAFRRQIDQLAAKEGVERASIERQLASAAPDGAPAMLGFDSFQAAELLRGSPEEIRRRQARYVEFLRGRENVLDAGCGRGEFLELLRASGIPAYGVDVDEKMVKRCRESGLDVRWEDAIDHLTGLEDGSLGGVVALQLVEHFDFVRLFQMFRLLGRKVRPGGIAVLETVNPACLTTFSGAFYADPTHFRPIHPEAARLMLEMVGFTDVRIEYSSPVSEADKLQPLTVDSFSDPALRGAFEALNRNIERMNSLLYNYADYAVVGRKSGDA